MQLFYESKRFDEYQYFLYHGRIVRFSHRTADAREDVGSLPVCSQQGQLLGMVTDRDLVLRALARSIDDLSSLTAKDIMTVHPVTITPDMDSHDAALVFSSHRIRRLPVTENEKLVGMLSLGDLASRPVCIDEAGDVLSAVSLAPGMD